MLVFFQQGGKLTLSIYSDEMQWRAQSRSPKQAKQAKAKANLNKEKGNRERERERGIVARSFVRLDSMLAPSPNFLRDEALKLDKMILEDDHARFSRRKDSEHRL